MNEKIYSVFAQQQHPKSSHKSITSLLGKRFKNNKMRSKKVVDTQSIFINYSPTFHPTATSSPYATTIGPTSSDTQSGLVAKMIDEMVAPAPAINTTMTVPKKKKVRSKRFFDAESISTSPSPTFHPTVSSSAYATTPEPTPSGTQQRLGAKAIDEIFVTAPTPAIAATIIVPTLILLCLVVFRQR